MYPEVEQTLDYPDFHPIYPPLGSNSTESSMSLPLEASQEVHQSEAMDQGLASASAQPVGMVGQTEGGSLSLTMPMSTEDEDLEETQVEHDSLTQAAGASPGCSTLQAEGAPMESRKKNDSPTYSPSESSVLHSAISTTIAANTRGQPAESSKEASEEQVEQLQRERQTVEHKKDSDRSAVLPSFSETQAPESAPLPGDAIDIADSSCVTKTPPRKKKRGSGKKRQQRSSWSPGQPEASAAVKRSLLNDFDLGCPSQFHCTHAPEQGDKLCAGHWTVWTVVRQVVSHMVFLFTCL